MPLHPTSEQKIMDIGSGESVNVGFLGIFQAVANEADLAGLDNSTLVIPMYDKEQSLEVGDQVAELHFVIRRVTDDNDDT